MSKDKDYYEVFLRDKVTDSRWSIERVADSFADAEWIVKKYLMRSNDEHSEIIQIVKDHGGK